MKAIIIDDERLARNHLRHLLQCHTQIQVMGEAANASQARALTATELPDLLFVDIQMPGENGFEFLESLARVPPVIFTTAYDGFALRAFEFNTLDYLLKPIDPERLLAALAKLDQWQGPTEPNDTGVQALTPGDKVFLKDRHRCWLIPLEDIRLLESEGNHTRVYFDHERPLIHRSLSQLEAKLGPTHFFRASRQHILNLKWVTTLDAIPNGAMIAKLTCGKSIAFSRRQAQKFRDMNSL